MRFSIVSAVVLVSFVSARADGIVHRLPDDGTGAVYELESTFDSNGKTSRAKGTLTMLSVGTTTVEKEKCRWLELQMVMRGDEGRRRMIYKVLIPEGFLRAGQAPMEHIVKSWWQRRDGEPELLQSHPKDENWGVLPLLLSGPPTKPSALDKMEVATPLGKIQCTGTRGTLKIEQESRKWEGTIETRLHEKAPFGVISMRLEMDVDRRGQRSKGTFSLKLIEIRKNVRGELADEK
jgi:hypothetical protein